MFSNNIKNFFRIKDVNIKKGILLICLVGIMLLTSCEDKNTEVNKSTNSDFYSIEDLEELKIDHALSYEEMKKWILDMDYDDEFLKIYEEKNTLLEKENTENIYYQIFNMEGIVINSRGKDYELVPQVLLALEYGEENKPRKILSVLPIDLIRDAENPCIFAGSFLCYYESGNSFFYLVAGDLEKIKDVESSNPITYKENEIIFNVTNPGELIKNIYEENRYYKSSLDS